ncbi:MAG: MarR family transcriptional regulator [Pseudomonadota bacterium]
MTYHEDPSYRAPTSFVTFKLARLQSQLNAQAMALLKSKSDLTLVEWRLIQVLRMFENASLTEIAEHVQMDKGQISRKITTMVRKGLLRVERDKQDQRVQHLQLTQAAEALSRRIMPTMQTRQRLLLADVSAADLQIFYEVVDKLEAAAQVREIE